MACIRRRRGRWVIDFYDQYGRRRWKTLPEGTTTTKPREELRTIEDMVAKRIFLPDRKVPLFSQVAGDWIEYKKPKVRETTWEVYEGHVKNHFHDLDDLKIKHVTVGAVEKFITDRQNQG